jgi:hypothetical protein
MGSSPSRCSTIRRGSPFTGTGACGAEESRASSTASSPTSPRGWPSTDTTTSEAGNARQATNGLSGARATLSLSSQQKDPLFDQVVLQTNVFATARGDVGRGSGSEWRCEARSTPPHSCATPGTPGPNPVGSRAGPSPHVGRGDRRIWDWRPTGKYRKRGLGGAAGSGLEPGLPTQSRSYQRARYQLNVERTLYAHPLTAPGLVLRS